MIGSPRKPVVVEVASQTPLRLPPNQAVTLAGQLFERKTMDQLAAEAGVTIEAIKKRLYRARLNARRQGIDLDKPSRTKKRHRGRMPRNEPAFAQHAGPSRTPLDILST